MAIAIISISTQGLTKLEYLKKLLERVSFASPIIKTSHIYETFDPYKIHQSPFLSCVAEIETDMNAPQFLEFLNQNVEQILSESLNPQKENLLKCHLIDYRGELARMPLLTLPHPETHKKAYIMIPLSEMEPGWEHPILKKTASELAQEVFWPGWGSFFANKESLLDF